MKQESKIVQEFKEKRLNPPHVLPIYASSSFCFDSIEQATDIFTQQSEGHVYSRYGNPTVDTTADKLATLEVYGSDLSAKAILTSSGMSAISTLMLAILPAGGKIVTHPDLYGGTIELFKKMFAPLRFEVLEIDLKNMDTIAETVDSNTVLYIESPANPTMTCFDIAAIAATCTQKGAKTVVDNTFCTMFIQQPLVLGADFVIYSTTKFLNGHGNSIAGVMIGKDVAFMEGTVWKAMKLFGTNCNPFDAWLTYIGLKTLAIRMRQHSDNAMQLATYLTAHEKVHLVNYTGLDTHPDHKLACNQMTMHGGMLSFELKGGLEAGKQFMNRIKLCTLAPTLGDVDTLVLHPASMSHLNIPKADREKVGITDGLIRLSVGIEHIDDLIADISQAIEG